MEGTPGRRLEALRAAPAAPAAAQAAPCPPHRREPAVARRAKAGAPAVMRRPSSRRPWRQCSPLLPRPVWRSTCAKRRAPPQAPMWRKGLATAPGARSRCLTVSADAHARINAVAFLAPPPRTQHAGARARSPPNVACGTAGPPASRPPRLRSRGLWPADGAAGGASSAACRPGEGTGVASRRAEQLSVALPDAAPVDVSSSAAPVAPEARPRLACCGGELLRYRHGAAREQRRTPAVAAGKCCRQPPGALLER